MPKTKKIKATGKPAIMQQKSFSATDKPVLFISNRKIQIALIAAICFIFYGNSINDGYATDDMEFYSSNQFVQKGVSGIYDLLTKESLYGFYGNSSTVSGGRWRPLSLITFALEKEYFNANTRFSHFINLLLLVLTGVIMLFFLRKYIFHSLPVAAFIATLLFIMHPVHTEAITHIKSRDELLSFLFLLLTMYCSLNFITTRKYLQLALSLLFYFLALLSKEDGITFIIILPLTFYFFTKEKARNIFLTTLPFAAVFAVYALIRFSIAPFIINNNNDISLASYIYATPVQRIATELMLLGKYILMLFYPNPLTSDYTYNQIPYVNFSDWRVWLSIIVQAALVIYALLKIKEKNTAAYGILFYFCSIFIVSNIVFDSGVIFAERFLYQPSFGFCLAVVAAADALVQKIKFKTIAQKSSLISALLLVIAVLSAFQTIQRNSEWKEDHVLCLADVKKSPNSIAIHQNLGSQFIYDANTAINAQQQSNYLNMALNEYDSALQIQPEFIPTLHGIGYTYFLMGNYSMAERNFLEVVDKDSTYSESYMGLGSIDYNEKNYQKALIYFKKSFREDSLNALSCFDIALCYHFLKQYDKEIAYYQKTLNLNPPPGEQVINGVDLQVVRQNLRIAERLLQGQ